MRAKLLLLLTLALVRISTAQDIDKQKVNAFAIAVAHAEGFGVRNAIPTKYHNPGDLKSHHGLRSLPGQRALGKGNHIIFSNDRAGWSALNEYIYKMVNGRSKRFNANMTIIQVAHMYAQNWRPWVKIVCRELNCTPTTRLRDLLLEPQPPAMPSLEVTNWLPLFPLVILFPSNSPEKQY